MSDPTGRGLRERATRVWEKLRSFGTPALVLLLTTVIAALGLGLWLTLRATSEPYTTLFTGLAAEDAATVAGKLKELKAPHRVGPGGVIEVPESRVHELRLEIAGAGLPRGGGVGFESFDKMRLGATEFEQHVMLRRAMEGELSRTISSVAAVESARVHLVQPEKSVFVQKRDPASASVVVKLRPGRELGGQEIGAIVHLVSSAVPGLSPDRVALATTEGVLLRRPRGDKEGAAGGADEEPLAMTRGMETALEERVRTMLERVVGPGAADVRVTAELDFAQVERTEDKFKPKSTALRSEELLIERASGADPETVAGVPGAESNLPTGDAEAEVSETTVAGVLRRQHTRNFEVDRVTERRVNRASTLKRLTVAVAVDGISGVDESGARFVALRDPEELAQLEKLVRSAVGADERREDLVTVECIPFAFAAAAAVDETKAAPAAPSPLEKHKKYAPYAAGALFALVALVALAARRRRQKKAQTLEASLLAASTGATLLPTPAEPPQLAPREEALRRAAEDPASAALVIRHWLGGPEQAAQRIAS